MMEVISEIQSLLCIADTDGNDQINSPFDKELIKNYECWNGSKKLAFTLV